MAQVFAAMMAGEADIGCVIVDFPRPDRCDPQAWDCVLKAGALAVAEAQKPLALVATLPEALSEDIAQRAVAGGMIPMHGLDDALTAIEAACFIGTHVGAAPPILRPGAPQNSVMLSEAKAKAALAAHGLDVPKSQNTDAPESTGPAAEQIGFPVVLKGTGVAHKTEAGLVALNLRTASDVTDRARSMACDGYLIEEMAQDGIAEILVGVLRDPAHGFVLTLGAGGVFTEILSDTTSLLLPVTRADVIAALQKLKIAPMLAGYRGASGIDTKTVAQAIMAVQDYVTAHAAQVEEVEINPLICTPTRAIAADALIRIGEET